MYYSNNGFLATSSVPALFSGKLSCSWSALGQVYLILTPFSSRFCYRKFQAKASCSFLPCRKFFHITRYRWRLRYGPCTPNCLLQNEKNVAFERHLFTSTAQLPDEPLDAFTTHLWQMVKSYDYRERANLMIRNELVDKCYSRDLWRRFLQKAELTLEKALSITHSIEASNHNATQMEAPVEVQVNSLRSRSGWSWVMTGPLPSHRGLLRKVKHHQRLKVKSNQRISDVYGSFYICTPMLLSLNLCKNSLI